MKLAALVLFVLTAILFWPLSANTNPPQKPEELAQKSAEAWLALTDSGKYDQSWDEAASFFKASITKEKWNAALKTTRAPLGGQQSRKLASATYKTSIPSAPEGQYVILRFNTSFENLSSSIETVTPMLDKDGKWRVSGYYIRPSQ